MKFIYEESIEDTVIYSGKPTHNYSDYSYLNVGYVDTSYKIGEVLVKFPTLSDDDFFSTKNSADILSSKFNYYTASNGSGTEVIKTYQINVGKWNTNTVSWGSAPMIFAPPSYLSSTTVNSGGGTICPLDITMAVKIWANGENSNVTPNHGILIFNEIENDPEECRDFLSVEYAASSSSRKQYMPSLEIQFRSTVSEGVLASSSEIIIKENEEDRYIEAYAIDDGIVVQSKDSDRFTFYSNDRDIVRVGAHTGELMPTAIGSTTIRIVYQNGEKLYENAVSIHVIIDEQISAPTRYVIRNDQDIYQDGEYTYSKSLTAIITRQGVEQNPNEDVEYLFVSCSNSKIDVTNNFTRFNRGDNVVPSVTVTVENRDLSHHEQGTITVRAVSKNDREHVYKDISINVVCDVDISEAEPKPSVDLCDGRYIRIPYSSNKPGTGNLESNAIYSGNKEAFSNNVGSFEYINYNFERDDYDIFYYDFLNASDNHVGGSGHDRKFFRLIRSSRIAFINSHGNIGMFSLNVAYDPDIDNSSSSNSVFISDIYNVHDDYFASCDLIIVFTCYSGTENDSGKSIAEAFSDKGAKCVIGFDSTLPFVYQEQFEEKFWENVAQNKSIAQVLSAINSSLDGAEPVVYGDTSIVLKED